MLHRHLARRSASEIGMRVGIVIYDGFYELDALAPYEVLKNAAATGAMIEVRLVTLRPCGQVKASHGLEVQSDGTLGEGFDWLVVAGGSWAARNAVGAWGEIVRGDLPSALGEQFRSGVSMASVCTGAMLLSAAGITRGRPVTTHHVARAALRDEGGRLIDARVVDDGNLITAGGVTSGLDLGLWMVERHFGPDLAEGIARQMEHTRVGPVWRAGDANQHATQPAFAATPTPPYYAVLFTRVRNLAAADDGYAVTAARMVELARLQPGFLGMESVEGGAGDGITLSYWASLDAIAAWKRHTEHALAQERGKAGWYRDYRLRVARVERERAMEMRRSSASAPDWR